MNLSTREIVAKSDLALSELTSSGGVLATQQAQKFLRLMIEQSVLMQYARVVPMRGPVQEIPKLSFASRILAKATDGTALGDADRSKPTLGKVTLTAAEMKAEVRLTTSTLEDSIERGDLKDTIMQAMAERIAVDMEDVVINGDTASASVYLTTMDGLLKQATSNIVNAGSADLTKAITIQLLKAMPKRFLRNRKLLALFTNTDAEIDYRDSLADRGTVMGDRMTTEDVPALTFGVPVIGVPMFPESSSLTNALLTDPKNCLVGVWRQITLETAKEISEGVLKIVATLRFATKFEEETAAVKGNNVSAD